MLLQLHSAVFFWLFSFSLAVLCFAKLSNLAKVMSWGSFHFWVFYPVQFSSTNFLFYFKFCSNISAFKLQFQILKFSTNFLLC